jgi:hypothetical protein
MIRILTALSAFVLLTGAQCSKAEIEKYSALVTTPPVQFVALEQESNRAWEEEVVVEGVPEPEPPPCVDYLWRGQWFACDGTWLRDL